MVKKKTRNRGTLRAKERRKTRRSTPQGKIRTRSHEIADMSLYYLGYVIASCGFTLDPVRSDYGYDVNVYTFDPKRRYENGNIFVQLKATDNLKIDKTSGKIKFRLKKRDIRIFQNEPMPVYLVVFDAKGEKAYAIYVQRYLSNAGISALTMKHDSLEFHLPRDEIDVTTVRHWRIDKNLILKQIGAVTHVKIRDIKTT